MSKELGNTIRGRSGPSLYIEYRDNWKSISRMAEFYGLPVKKMSEMVNRGMAEHLGELPEQHEQQQEP